MTFQIYGGGHLKSNNRLNITANHLLAVYSGGKLSHNHAGYVTKEGRTGNQFEPSEGPGQGTGNTGGASGAGHAGSGGRGTVSNRVGRHYGTLYYPWQYGSAGGYGNHYGKSFFIPGLEIPPQKGHKQANQQKSTIPTYSLCFNTSIILLSR